MAGPYTSLTSPYAPGPGHMNDAFRIADLIGQQGQSAAQAQYAKRLMVGDLVGGIGSTIGGIFGARDQQKRLAQEAEVLAELFSSGQPVDLPTLIQKLGIDRAKALYPMLEAEVLKRKTASKEANELGLRQRSADALRQGVDPTKVNIELYGENAPLLPAAMMPDPKVAAEAAAEKKLAAKKALVAEAVAYVKHGMSKEAANQWYAAQTGGETLPDDIFAPAAPKVERKLITVPGPGGVPVQRYATEAELEAGVQIYRAPTDTGSGTGLPKLTGAQQDDLATMDTVVDLSRLATTLGDKIGWKGVGGLWTGTITGQAAKVLGLGTADEENLRNYLGNIQGTIAKLRGGTAFSAAEKAMLDSYTPGTDDADHVIQAKLKSLGEFIALKRANALRYAGGGAGQPLAPMPSHPPGGAEQTRGSGPFSVKVGPTTYRFQTKAKLDEYKRRAGLP